MKTQLLIALGAVAALLGAANAQSATDDDYGVHLKKAPDFGPLLRAPGAPAPRRKGNSVQVDESDRVPLEFFPNLGKSQPAGTRLKIVKSPDGNTLQVEAGQQSLGDVLQKIADVMGVKAVIDPQLQKETHASLFFRGKDFDDLLSLMSYAMNIEIVKSPSGTYFFAAKPASSQQTPRNPRDLRNGPFLFGPGENTPNPDPDFSPLKPKSIQPQPDWEKREFNGRPYYNMPLPVPGLPGEKFFTPYILPVPRLGPVR